VQVLLSRSLDSTLIRVDPSVHNTTARFQDATPLSWRQAPECLDGSKKQKACPFIHFNDIGQGGDTQTPSNKRLQPEVDRLDLVPSIHGEADPIIVQAISRKNCVLCFLKTMLKTIESFARQVYQMVRCDWNRYGDVGKDESQKRRNWRAQLPPPCHLHARVGCQTP
jgi:hypothetical protein